jgi:hypothetical protein
MNLKEPYFEKFHGVFYTCLEEDILKFFVTLKNALCVHGKYAKTQNGIKTEHTVFRLLMDQSKNFFVRFFYSVLGRRVWAKKSSHAVDIQYKFI